MVISPWSSGSDPDRRPDERPVRSGATIDFVDTIEKQGFTIDNPNATGSLRLRRSFN